MKGLILLIEDNEDLNSVNRRALEMRDYDVLTALNLAEARRLLASHDPDVILLDVMLPDGNGFEFCDEIRDATTAHIIFLTARAEQEDMLRGFQGGGDYYITKPFHPEGLLSRVEAAMRRRAMDNKPPREIRRGSLKLDLVANRAYVGTEDLFLTQKEFAFLRLLVSNEGKSLSASEIYENVWKLPLLGDKNAIQTVASRLRRKLGTCGYTVTALRGQGYVFEHL